MHYSHQNGIRFGFFSVCVILFGSTSVCFGHKNVLFLMADDLRVQISAYYGRSFATRVHPRMHTPNLDKLASKSLVLKKAYVQQAVCCPSRASILTGRRPDTTHVYYAQYWREVGGNYTTIPQYFKNHGYQSIGMGKIFHTRGKASGFDDAISWTEKYYRSRKTPWEKNHTSWIAVPDSQLIGTPLVDQQIADNAISVLRRVARGTRSDQNPFFMAVGFHRPHLPWVFPASVLRYYPESDIHLPSNSYVPKNMPEIAWTEYNELRNFLDIRALNVSGKINTTLPENTVLEMRRAYYCSVTWMDFQVGRVLDELERLGLADDTIISFLGDHGWQLGEHNEWSKHTNFEITTHAPLMIRVPGKTDSGIVSESLVEFVDLFPTLVEAAGLPDLSVCPKDSQTIHICREGSSFTHLFHYPNLATKHAAFSQFPRTWQGQSAMGYSIRTEHFRYTEWVKFQMTPNYRPDWNTLYGVELYDHSNDPDENNNVAYVVSYKQIRGTLSEWLHSGWRGSQANSRHNLSHGLTTNRAEPRSLLPPTGRPSELHAHVAKCIFIGVLLYALLSCLATKRRNMYIYVSRVMKLWHLFNPFKPNDSEAILAPSEAKK